VQPSVAWGDLVDQSGELRRLERGRRFAGLFPRAAALLTAAVRAPHVRATGDLRHGAIGGHAGDAGVDQRVAIVRIGEVVGDLLEHPRLRLFAGARL
jgi:hypothetical protein